MPTSKCVEAAADAPLLITMGEPAGIGPEVALAAFAALNGRIGSRPLKLVGAAEVFSDCGTIPAHALIPTKAKASRHPGRPSADNAAATIEAIATAIDMAMAGQAAGLVTAPIHKAVLMEAGFRHPGHTDFLAERTATPDAVMMLAGPALRVVPLTVHIPFCEVAGRITKDAIVSAAAVTLQALERDFRIAAPRLAIAGLNPHAGESGKIGREEQEIIIPAIEELRAAGADVAGPLPSDTMFHEEARRRYDAALCMYHDQALIPLKTLAFWDGVNVTLGLPIVRTSPDHGTGFDIAGRGKADARSMIAAIRMAADIADARHR